MRTSLSHLFCRGSHLRCSMKKAVLKDFTIFTKKKTGLDSLFNKVASFQACNFILKRLQHGFFPANIAKFLRAPILNNTCDQLRLLVAASFSIHLSSRVTLTACFLLFN